MQQDSHGPQFSMGSRSQVDLNRSVPGPGHYDQDRYDRVRPKTRGVVMGKEPRSKEKKPEDLPGPGHYATPQKSGGPTWRFGSERREKSLNESFPSPGAYDLPDSRSRGGYTMAGRHSEAKDDSVPGPGAYNTKLKKNAPSFSMGGSRTALKPTHDSSPGPGAYTPAVKTSSPNVK